MINSIKPTFGFLLLLSLGMNVFMLAGLSDKNTEIKKQDNSIANLIEYKKAFFSFYCSMHKLRFKSFDDMPYITTNKLLSVCRGGKDWENLPYSIRFDADKIKEGDYYD